VKRELEIWLAGTQQVSPILSIFVFVFRAVAIVRHSLPFSVFGTPPPTPSIFDLAK
jgi:hypothetical protein